MNRKEFLQIIGGAAAASAAGISAPVVGAASSAASSGTSVGGPAPAHKLTRGISSYSYQIAIYLRQMSMEDVIAEASSIGAYNIEILPDELPEYPNFSDQFVKQWQGWMDKYHTKPDSWTQHIDIFGPDRLRWDIEQAKRFGFPCIRMMLQTPLDITEKCVPDAEKANVVLLYEIHGPTRIDGPEIGRIVQLIEKTKSKHLGLNPDFSLWEKRPSPARRDGRIRAGTLNPIIAQFIEEAQAGGMPQDKVTAEIAKMGATEGDVSYLRSRYDGYQDPKKLLPLKPYIRRFHAKFWEMTEDFTETSVPYEEVVPFLIANGFEGPLASEYEGQRSIMDAYPVDEVEQVRRHQIMLKGLLGV